jgi:putative transposase
MTTSTYRRARLFDSLRFRRNFVNTLDALRTALQFKIVGYVLMPEHFHLFIWPSGKFDPSQILKSLKERTAKYILRNLLDRREHPWCRKMLDRVTLPASVHDESHYRVWQRRFYDMSIWTEKKRVEKLRYMHGNPVKRGLVDSPEKWPWSSFRFYFLEDASVLAMDRLP